TARDADGKLPDEADHESDVRTITRAIYRFNDAGYLDADHPSHIWVADAPGFAEEPVTARQLTSGKYEEDDPVWSRDGARVYFSTTHIDEPYYELPQSDIYAVPAAGGESQKIAALDFGVAELSLSTDG